MQSRPAALRRLALHTRASCHAAAHVALALGAVLLPLWLWTGDFTAVGSSDGRRRQLFELLGLCGSLALAAAAARELWPRRRASLRELAPLLLFFLVGFHYLGLVSGYARTSWDYQRYEEAARALLADENPYQGTFYLYPPLAAQVLAGSLRRIQSWGAPDPSHVVFYLYQCAQLLLVLAAWWLCVALLGRWGVEPLRAAALASLALVFDHPLLRTLANNQANLWILDLSLLAIVCAAARPRLAGAALALAAHIKLYPCILLAPLLAARRFRPVLWFAVAALLVAWLQTGLGHDWTPWRQFLAAAGAFPEFSAFRNSSLHGLFINLFGFAASLGVPGAGLPAARAAAGAATLAVLVWFGVRFVRREAEARAAAGGGGPAAGQLRADGHLIDALACGLLISPLVWEHHYVLALPAVLWTAVARGREHPWRVGIAAALVLLPPTFEVFPLSYHRLAGLLLLVWTAAPRPVAPSPRGA